MKFSVITLFPHLIEVFCDHGLLGQARRRGRIQINTLNPRQFTNDPHHTVDDRAFGGGDGMVMKVEPLRQAVQSLRAQGPVKVVALTPQGRRWNQEIAKSWAQAEGHIALVCGRYAGFDQRFLVQHVDEEISLGDFILNGGEVAAAALIESTARLLDGVLGNDISAEVDSFSDGLLECPQFTRPREIEGLPVPEPLLSGHHQKIQEFTRAVSLIRTAVLRPDLLQNKSISKALEQVAELKDAELKALGLSREQLEALS